MPRYVGGALAKSFSALLSVSQTPQASGIPTHSPRQDELSGDHGIGVRAVSFYRDVLGLDDLRGRFRLLDRSSRSGALSVP
jgi:hypothetical protein